MIAPIAAVGLLVAGLLGAAQINTQQDVVPAQSPSDAKTSTPTAATSKVGTPSPSPSAPSSAPSSADPNAALAMRPMTRSELDQQTKACLKVPKGATAEPRQGKMKVAYAMQQAVAGYPTDGAVRPVLVLEDDLGYYYCSKSEKTWSSKNGDHFTVDPSAAGHDLLTISGGSSFTCGADEDDAQVESSAVVSITSAAAKTARVTIITRSGKRTVTIGVHQGYLAVPVQVNGAAAWSRSTLRFELLDAADRPLEVQSYGAQTTRRLDYATLSCADVQPHPTPTIKHPASDSAGVDRCRNLAAQYLDSGHSGSFNLKKATARVTVSTKGEWGAVLSDGKHYVGCSLFPTEEISSIRRVTPGTGVAAFGWATNPINPHGDSLWAAAISPAPPRSAMACPTGPRSTRRSAARATGW